MRKTNTLRLFGWTCFFLVLIAVSAFVIGNKFSGKCK
jgi:hypothetical protein